VGAVKMRKVGTYRPTLLTFVFLCDTIYREGSLRLNFDWFSKEVSKSLLKTNLKFRKMKNYLKEIGKIVLVASFFIFFVIGLITLFNKCDREKLEGYIISTQNKFEWVKDEFSLNIVPRETVEVQLLTGEVIEAEIVNSALTHLCVKYRDYPPAKGKRVKVTLEKKEDKFFIFMGEIVPL